jgi:hypothetical protein
MLERPYRGVANDAIASFRITLPFASVIPFTRFPSHPYPYQSTLLSGAGAPCCCSRLVEPRHERVDNATHTYWIIQRCSVLCISSNTNAMAAAEVTAAGNPESESECVNHRNHLSLTVYSGPFRNEGARHSFSLLHETE